MSLLWTDSIHAYVHPDQLVLVRQTGWFKRKITVKQLLLVSTHGEHLWSGVIKLLESKLKEPEWQKSRAVVTLSNHFFHYRVAPWQIDLTAQEQATLAQHHLVEVHGNIINDWEIQISDAGYGKPRLACAFDPRLNMEIKKIFSQSSSRLISIKPLLMAAINRWRKKIVQRNAWFVLTEGTHLIFVLFQNGEWRGVRSKTYGDDWERELGTLLEREALRLGVDESISSVYCCWPDRPLLKIEALTNQTVQNLSLPQTDGFSPEQDAFITFSVC